MYRNTTNPLKNCIAVHKIKRKTGGDKKNSLTTNTSGARRSTPIFQFHKNGLFLLFHPACSSILPILIQTFYSFRNSSRGSDF